MQAATFMYEHSLYSAVNPQLRNVSSAVNI